MRQRLVAVAVAAGLSLLAWVTLGRGRAGREVAPAAGEEAEEATGASESLFEEFPETDNPEVARLYLAWRLAERALGAEGARGGDALRRQIKLFGKLYREIGQATRR